MRSNQNFIVSLLIGRSKTGKQTDVLWALRTKPGLPQARKGLRGKDTFTWGQGNFREFKFKNAVDFDSATGIEVNLYLKLKLGNFLSISLDQNMSTALWSR